MTRLWTITALCSALLLPVAGNAQARNPRQMAATHSSAGGAAMAARDYSRALAEYVMAYAYDTSPDRLVNVARAYEGLGNKGAAKELYERVIAVARSGPAVDQARAQLAGLGGGARPAGGTPFTLTVIPMSAEVWIDGTKRGKSPLPPITLSAGVHKVEVRFPGYQTWIQNIQVTAGVPVARVVTLMPGASAPPRPATPPGMALLQVTDIPAGATVTLNGQPVPVAGSTASANVRAGQYTLLVQMAGQPNFVKVIAVAANQPVAPVRVVMGGARPIPTPGPGTSGPAASLAGSWAGLPIEAGSGRTQRKISLSLSGPPNRLTGEMVVQNESKLPRWKQKNCGNSPTVKWETRYRIRLASAAGGKRIVGTNGTESGCSCKGMCSSDSSLKMGVFVGTDNQVMASEDLIFVRKVGNQAPTSALMSRVNLTRLTGRWDVQVGSVDEVKKATAQLTGRPGSVSGQLTKSSVTRLAKYRRKECGGAAELTATHHFEVSGKPDGSGVKLSFSHVKYSKCSCKPSACSAAASTERLSTETLRMTVDGNHLIGPGMVLTRK